MTIEYLKRGKPEADRAADDAKTAEVVAATLKDIEERGDVAVRELANRFDNYDRESYRLSQDEIDALIAKVSPQDMGVLGGVGARDCEGHATHVGRIAAVPSARRRYPR